MKVIYDNQLNTEIEDDANVEEVFEILKENFPELNNGSYEVTNNESGEKIMNVYLSSGDKG